MRARKRLGLLLAALLADCRAGGMHCAPFMDLPEEFGEPCTEDEDCGDDLQCLARPGSPEQTFCTITCETSSDCQVAFNDTSGCMMCSDDVCGGFGCD